MKKIAILFVFLNFVINSYCLLHLAVILDMSRSSNFTRILKFVQLEKIFLKNTIYPSFFFINYQFFPNFNDINVFLCGHRIIRY